MAVDMFMKIEGTTGESKDSNHKDWSDIRSFAWGATQPGSMSTGGGGGIGKASFNDLNVIAYVDRSAPAVMQHCSTGKHLSSVQVSVCKAGGTQVEYSRITLEDVLVTSVQYTGAHDGEGLLVNYAFQAARIKKQYWEQTEQGGKGAESVIAYDVKQNKVVG